MNIHSSCTTASPIQTLDVVRAREKLATSPTLVKELFERLVEGGSALNENVFLLRQCGMVLGRDVRLYGRHTCVIPRSPRIGEQEVTPATVAAQAEGLE